MNHHVARHLAFVLAAMIATGHVASRLEAAPQDAAAEQEGAAPPSEAAEPEAAEPEAAQEEAAEPEAAQEEAAQEEAAEPEAAQEEAAQGETTEEQAAAEAQTAEQEKAAGQAATIPWPTGWATCVARSVSGDGGQELIVATAEGLLLREAAVVATRVDDPSQVRELYRHPVSVWAVATSGPWIASSDYRGNLALMNKESGQMTMHENALERWTRALVFAPDGQHVVAGNEAGKLIVWSVGQGAVTKAHESDPAQIYDVAFSPDGATLAVADGAGHVHLLSWPELEPRREIQLGDQPIWAVAFSSDGASLIAGGSERKLWRVAVQEGSEPTALAETTDWITDITVDAGGIAAICTLDGKVLMIGGAGDGAAEQVGQVPSGAWGIAMPTSSTLVVATRKHAVATLGRAWTILHAEEPTVDEGEAEGDEEAGDEEAGDEASE